MAAVLVAAAISAAACAAVAEDRASGPAATGGPSEAGAPPLDGARLYPGFDGYSREASRASAAARPFLDQALQWLYGFNDDEAVRAFRRAARLDPECAFAWWGVAYANGINVNDPVMSERESRDARDAIERALALRERASPVDRALIDALSKRYASHEPAEQRSLAIASSRSWRRRSAIGSCIPDGILPAP